MSKSKRFTTTKIPNQLIQDTSLSFSARRPGAVLYGHSNRLGCCRKSLATLATLSKLSVTTVQKAINELSSAGYIAHIKTYRYNEQLGRMVYAVGIYHCLLPVSRDFTLVPRALFDTPLQGSAFVAALYLYQQTGNGSRCFPSLNAICRGMGASVSTVCRAVKALGIVRLFLALHCKKVNQAYSSNSYFILFRSAGDVSDDSESVRRSSPQLSKSAPFASRIKHITPIRILQAIFSLFSKRGYFQNWQTTVKT